LNKETPLHLAIKYENIKIFNILIKSEKLKIDHLINTYDDDNKYNQDYAPIHYVCKTTADNVYMLEYIIYKLIEIKLNARLKSFFNHNLSFYFVKQFTPLLIDINKNPNNDELLHRIELKLNDFYKQIGYVNVNMLNKLEILTLITDTCKFMQDELINKKSNKCGQRPLNLAIKANNINITSTLFKYGANPNLYSDGKYLPIHLIALNYSNNSDLLNLMMQHNAISFKHNEKMENLFHLAALTNNHVFLERIFNLIDDQLIKRNINSIDSNQFTPLFKVVSAYNNDEPNMANNNNNDNNDNNNDDSLKTAQLLIQNEHVNKYHLDSNQNNLFHICALFNSYKLFNYLILNHYDLIHLVYEANSSLETVLHLAAIKNHILIFRNILHLIKLKKIEPARLFKKKNLAGETFFQVACKHGSIDIVKLVLNQIKFDNNNYNPIKDLDNNADTPLLKSISSNQYEIVYYLLVNGHCTLSDINAENNNKQIALHLSSQQGSVEISDLLLKYGSYLNVYDKFGFNPLVYACGNGNTQLVEYYLNLEVNLFE